MFNSDVELIKCMNKLNDEYLINKDEFSDVKAIDVSSQYYAETKENTLDYDNKTMWHSDWADNSQTLPQYITYDLGAAYDLTDITFLGTFEKYSLLIILVYFYNLFCKSFYHYCQKLFKRGIYRSPHKY